MTTTNDKLVGTTYDGRYRIEKRIGQGGMANVYLAEDETLGRRVAIKVLHQRYAEDSQFVERFLREASAAAKLNHPNIVQVYDRGQAADTYYIAMEYVDGMTLKDLVRRRGGLTEQECLAYGRQALHALRFAHRNGIVHRDVKPHNMMVDTDGRLKIADFGIARAAADADSGLTEAGSIVGTAQYLSPEQAQGHEVAASSDLYSLGVVMFEMATGRVPFDGESPVNVALKHVKDPVPRPSSLNREVTPAIESIILKAMEKDPTRRYSTADEMLADLDRAREGSATSAMTAIIGGVAPVGGMAGTTQVSPMVPTPVPATSRRYETPIAPEPAWPDSGWDEEKDGSRSVWRWLLPLLIVLILAGAAAYFLLMPKGDPVPDVVGQTQVVATRTLVAEGFVVGQVDLQASDSEAKGIVLEQSPGGGDELEAGGKVDLVVSSGPDTVEIPDVVGKARGTAINELRAAQFDVKVGESETSETVKPGFVISQSPNGEAEPGTTVTIILSSGPEAEQVPSVVDMQFDEAKALLEKAPYEFVVQRVDVDGPQAAGTVVSQDPAANTDQEPGTTIVLQVASGENAVPDVINDQVEAAEAALVKAGFQVSRVAEATEDPNQIGVVTATDPAAGTTRTVGDTVTVTFYEGAGDAEPVEPVEPVEEG